MKDLSNISTDNLLDNLVECVAADPDNCPPDLIDEISYRISNEYLMTPNRIIEEKSAEKSREMMIDWIKHEDTKILLCFSGGKDSVAMVLHLLDLGIDPSRIELHHQLVDGKEEGLFDWKTTTGYCQAFADHFGCPIVYSYRGGGIEHEVTKGKKGKGLEKSGDFFWQSEPGGSWETFKFTGEAKERGMWPATTNDLNARWCSAYVKIDVFDRMLNNSSRFAEGNIAVLTGERRKESTNRSGYAEIEPYSKTIGLKRKAITWRPVIDWLADDVWKIMERYKVNPHPAYHLGWGRCSCQTCIYNSPDIFATIKEISPDKIQRISDLEKQIGFTWRPDEPVEQYISRGNSLIQEGDQHWIDQATKEWTAPIVVENWKLPRGAKSNENCGAS